MAEWPRRATLPDDDEAPAISTVQYPTADMNVDRGGEESADEQRRAKAFAEEQPALALVDSPDLLEFAH
jgi:hypothetical protein